MSAGVERAFAHPARQAARLSLHGLTDKAAQSLALSNLYGAIEIEAAFGQNVPLDARVDALARCIAMTLHFACKDKRERERRAREVARAVTLGLDILARSDAAPPARAEIKNQPPKNAPPEEGAP